MLLEKWKILNIVDSKANFVKTLELSSLIRCEIVKCKLKSLWYSSPVAVNQIVYIKAKQENNDFVVDENGYICLYPDLLISGTTVVGSLFCRRKGVLQQKFGQLGGTNKSMLVGTMVHDLLQTMIKKETKVSYDSVKENLDDLLRKSNYLHQIWANQDSIQTLKSDIEKYIPNVVQFASGLRINDRTLLKDVKSIGPSDAVEVSDIEENLWIPSLGLKGKIDITLENKRTKTSIPLEIKTGRCTYSNEHKAQLAQYEMMLTEIGRKTASGALSYILHGELKDVNTPKHEKNHLIMLRNDMVVHLMDKTINLPEPSWKEYACPKCPFNTVCTVFQHDESSNTIDDHIKQSFFQFANNLTKNDLEFFFRWVNIICMEYEESKKTNTLHSIWTDDVDSRVSKGSCIAELRLERIQDNDDGFTHCFISNRIPYDHKFLQGDYIVLSTDKQVGISTGFVDAITDTEVKIFIEKRLNTKFHSNVLTMDKIEDYNSSTTLFNNMGMLLENTTDAQRLRLCIVEKIEATFSKTVPNIVKTEGVEILRGLNIQQRNAALDALATEKYMLLKGLPGTGKTKTIIAIIRLFVLCGKTVLVTSHTNSAVDNVLIRLKSFNIPFMRLGSEKKINPSLSEFSETYLTRNCKTPVELDQVYNNCKVFGVTCYGSSHVLLSRKMFDICIVDEATQVYQPLIIKPLLAAKAFILVGDPKQLPPLIKSKESLKLGSSESLFHRLDSAATITLSSQYRMNKTISKLANEVTYNGVMECGTDVIKMGTLKIPTPENMRNCQKWIHKTLEKHVDQSVIVLNTMDVSHLNNNIGENYKNLKIIADNSNQINFCEAAVCFKLLKALIVFGNFAPKNIGVILPYRSQVNYVRNILKNDAFKDLEIDTVDTFQGRDKELIIFGCTRYSHNENHSSNLQNHILNDHERLTVAITRSKYKLIIVGSEEFLKCYKPFEILFNKIPKRCKINLENQKLDFCWEELLKELDSISS